MNTQRRTFRGRGGPTDRRLPKHNARRRRVPARKPAANKYADEDNQNETAVATDNADQMDIIVDDVGDDDDSFEYFSEDENEHSSSELSENEPSDGLAPTAPVDEAHVQENAKEVAEKTSAAASPCVKEVKHLLKRVQNIRETMQLSNSIVNPKSYQDHILNAVSNCVNEWRSIVTHYPPAPETRPNGDDTTYLTPELSKSASLAVFEMIQHSTQCGPLTGAKPGYFKRCGGDVAKVVDQFLDEVIPHAPVLIQRMGFTTKQMDALNSWQKNARKAALENKPPSRTALKHQQGKGTGKKTKKKMKG